MKRPFQVTALFLLALFFAPAQHHAPSLQVHFGDSGLETLTYNGELLEDISRWPGDTFHIWHMLCFDLQGRPLSTGGYGWGETNKGRHWDPASRSWTYLFQWGSIQAFYVQRGDILDIRVVETNLRSSGVVLDGASIFPVSLHPSSSLSSPTGINDDSEGPGITVLDWGSSKAAVVIPDAEKPVYSGFQEDVGNAQRIIVSGTRPDALPHIPSARGRSVRPGETDSYVVSLRFMDRGVSVEAMAQDAIKSFARTWPQLLNWPDRRPIGTVFLASSPQGNKFVKAGFPSNPRRYFNDQHMDVKGKLTNFQDRVLKQAETIVKNLKTMNAQGAITWDIEGEEYPQDTSYLCSPDQIARLSPEMESILPAGSTYAGAKLDDTYFNIIRQAGFRVGLCVRPQRLAVSQDGSGRQNTLTDEDVASELIHKMHFAHDRWGITLFYLDSTVRADGSTLPAAIIERIASAFPDSLLIPEEASPRMYRSSAPFLTFLFHGDTGTTPLVRACYPRAFSAILINDANPLKLRQSQALLSSSVRKGDVLMGLATYFHENNEFIHELYRDLIISHTH